MKTEQQIIDSIEKVRKGLYNTINTLKNDLVQERYDEASETCYTILANILALEAAKRIID
ncbi:MAG: hypothetical protein ACHQF4_02355 [Sphingobacteriales bacterium]|jgi:hypothetical protein